MSKYTKEEIENAKAELKSLLSQTSSDIYGNITHVSASGMSHKIRFYLAMNDGEKNFIEDITWLISRALESPMDDRGLKVSGCGMDMIFHTVYNLGYALGINNLANSRYSRM